MAEEELLEGPEENPALPQSTPPPQLTAGKKQSKWFKKIPPEVLGSPGGMILLLMAGVMEIIDLIPVPFIDNLWELPLEIIFMVLLATVAKLPLQSMVIPFIVERIPIINDIIPTWLLRVLR